MIGLVELGPGTCPHPRAQVGIDLTHPINAPAQDAGLQPYPASFMGGMIRPGGWRVNDDAWTSPGERYLKDGEVEQVYASHFLEHIPAGPPRIAVFNEAWRVLKPGGTFTFLVPLVGIPGSLVQSHEAWADPTHVSHWWFPHSLLYFTDHPQSADYGIRPWQALGPRLTDVEADQILADDRDGTTVSPWGLRSFWAVRGGWEGVARLVKP